MKNVGYVLSEFPVLSETFVGNEMRAMARQGHKVVPIVLNRPAGPAQIDDVNWARDATYVTEIGNRFALDGLRACAGAFPKALDFLARQQSLPRKSLLGNALKIAAIAKRNKCSHLHAHFSSSAAAHAIIAARWIGAKVSFVCHGYDVYGGPTDLRLKLRSADFVVAVCNDMRDDLAAIWPETKLSMVPCGTDPIRFSISDDVVENGRLLFVGRLVEQKGLEELLEACALAGAEAAPLDIVGDGPLLDQLRAQAAELGLGDDRLRFLGSKPAEWIASEGASYLGLVAPFRTSSTGQRDTGPLVIKEAMAMGLPVIGTRFMGIKETITPDTGYLVEPFDRMDLANALKSLSNAPQSRRRAMGAAGRARVLTHFSLETQAASLSALVEAA